METKVAHTVNPLAALHPLFLAAAAKTFTLPQLLMAKTAEWGSQAYFEYAHVGGRGIVPTITDRNGRGVILRPWHVPGVDVRYTEVE